MPDELSQEERDALAAIKYYEHGLSDEEEEAFSKGKKLAWLAHRAYAQEQRKTSPPDAISEVPPHVCACGQCSPSLMYDGCQWERLCRDAEGEVKRLKQRVADLESPAAPAKSHDYPLVGFDLSYRDGMYRVSQPNLLKEGERLHVVPASRLVDAQAEIEQLREVNKLRREAKEPVDGPPCTPEQPCSYAEGMPRECWEPVESQPADLEPTNTYPETSTAEEIRAYDALVAMENGVHTAMLDAGMEDNFDAAAKVARLLVERDVSQQQEITEAAATLLHHWRLATSAEEWVQHTSTTDIERLQAALSPSEDTAR